MKNNNPTTVYTTLEKVYSLVEEGKDKEARVIFNSTIYKTVDIESLDDQLKMFIFELDRYFNDKGLKYLGAPVTDRSYILLSKQEFLKKLKKETRD